MDYKKMFSKKKLTNALEDCYFYRQTFSYSINQWIQLYGNASKSNVLVTKVQFFSTPLTQSPRVAFIF